MNLSVTRAIIHALLDGDLARVPLRREPFFGLEVPTVCPEVDPNILDPRNTWADQAAYDDRAKQLAASFRENFRQFAAGLGDEVSAGGPPEE